MSFTRQPISLAHTTNAFRASSCENRKKTNKYGGREINTILEKKEIKSIARKGDNNCEIMGNNLMQIVYRLLGMTH